MATPKKEQIVDSVEANTVEAVETPVTEVKADKIVNGVNFGARNNLKQIADEETGVVTFHVITGETVLLDFNKVLGLEFASLNALQKQFVIFGGTNKIKQGLAGIKTVEEVTVDGVTTSINALAAAITSAIAVLESGQFVTRTGSASEGLLSDVVKAFAITAGLYDSYSFYTPAFAVAVKQEEGYTLFNDAIDDATLALIKTTWENLSVKEKALAKKSPMYQYTLSCLDPAFRQARAGIA